MKTKNKNVIFDEFMTDKEIIKMLQIKNGKLQILIDRLKLDKEEYYLDYLNLQQRIDKAIEYCEDIIEQQIDNNDDDFSQGEDFTAREIYKILKGSEEDEN